MDILVGQWCKKTTEEVNPKDDYAHEYQ